MQEMWKKYAGDTSQQEKHRMCDIHIHIVPGVDDGSWNLDMSKTMADMIYLQGIQKMIATPHSSAFDEDSAFAKAAFEELKEEIGKRNPDMELYLGSEIHCTRREMKNVLHNLHYRIYPAMNGTQYVLTEFDTGVDQDEASLCTEALIADGWIPILAHVERYKRLFDDEACVMRLKEKGILLQINAFSLCEEHKEEIRRNAQYLVEHGLADFLGSDGHRMNHRPPSVEYGLNYLYHNFALDDVEALAFRNAERLLLSHGASDRE